MKASVKVVMIPSSLGRFLPASEQQRWRNGRKATGKARRKCKKLKGRDG